MSNERMGTADGSVNWKVAFVLLYNVVTCIYGGNNNCKITIQLYCNINLIFKTLIGKLIPSATPGIKLRPSTGREEHSGKCQQFRLF